MTPSGQVYKIKLASGRILGPLDLERVRLLILKNQITGTEVAREYPNGEWVDVNSILPIAEMLVARAEGRLSTEPGDRPAFPYDPIRGDPNPTHVLPGTVPVNPGAQDLGGLPELKTLSELGVASDGDRTAMVDASPKDGAAEGDDGERTVIATSPSSSSSHPAADASVVLDSEPASVSYASSILSKGNATQIAQESTVLFQRPAEGGGSTGPGGGPPPKNRRGIELLKRLAVLAALAMVGYEFLQPDGPQRSPAKWEPVRPKLPDIVQGTAQPEQSAKLYMEAMKDYVLDNVAGYGAAAAKLRKASAQDPGNVKALAMLASSYLNLIDSSNKDENYFSVISKLIDMSRAKDVDLPETVIAEVEFFITVNRPEAAQTRIVEFTKNREIDLSMFYYIALSFYHRGDAQTAARYLGQVPDNKAFSAKVFYLRGLVAEKLNDPDTALREYEKAVAFNGAHARSRLKIAELKAKRGTLKEAAGHLDYLVTHPGLLAPKELASAYYHHAQLSELYNKADVALGDLERAVKLDRENPDYQLSLFTMRAKAGDVSIKAVQKDARMYFFLSEGQKVLRLGQHHEALVQFMQAHEANPASPLPLTKIGDMFSLQNDLSNATANYRKAAEKAPQDIAVWSKYISALIQSYEWDEAKKAMDRFRSLPVPQSAIDKAAADWHAKQGQQAEAQQYYRKAMARESVDPGVYIAYAKSLMATRNFKEAPFFFALALRFDPLNMEAILGTARCAAETESVDRAISMLQDELSKGPRSAAELLTAIAEFHIQKGDWEQAQQFVDQARAADPDFAGSYRVQGRIHMNKEGLEKDALDKALAAYQSYVERNPSDAQGHLERYNIFLKKLQFDKASEELGKIYATFPKYPKLHYYNGWLYSAQGNHKLAAEEYQKELQNNPTHVPTLLALGKEKIELGQVGGPGSAQELFNKAMQLAPTNPEPKHQAGYAAYLLKNYAAAVALFNGALVYDKANPMIYKRLGMAYREMGDHQGASRAFRKYLEMEPDAPDKAQFERYR